MDEPLFHSQTKADFVRYLASPAHALLLVAPAGSGKTFAAKHLAKQLLNVSDAHQLASHPFFKIIAPEKNTIPIEAIRELRSFVKLKIPRLENNHIGRLIIIEHAHRLTNEAQNALLKLLEEPPAGTAIILTAHHEEALLPTIRSRSQTVQVRSPEKTALASFFQHSGMDLVHIERAYLMSGGLPGLMSALLTNEAHPVLASVTIARSLLQSTPFERLAAVDGLSKSKDESLQVLAVLQRMAQAALAGAAAKSDEVRPLRQWHRILASAAEAEQALTQNAQAKLVLTNLMLSL